MPLYLSRLLLDSSQREVRRALGDCHTLHQLVMSGFGDVPESAGRAALGVLHRLDPPRRQGPPLLLVQSLAEPHWAALTARGLLAPARGGPANPATKRVDEVYATIAAGDVFAFRLRANPTRRVGADQANTLAGKRVGVFGEEAQLAWLERKGTDAGFSLMTVQAHPDVADVRAQPSGTIAGRRASGGVGTPAHRMSFFAVLYEGTLRVDDPEALRGAIREGIGSAKAYGFGLLSLARPGTVRDG